MKLEADTHVFFIFTINAPKGLSLEAIFLKGKYVLLLRVFLGVT